MSGFFLAHFVSHCPDWALKIRLLNIRPARPIVESVLPTWPFNGPWNDDRPGRLGLNFRAFVGPLGIGPLTHLRRRRRRRRRAARIDSSIKWVGRSTLSLLYCSGGGGGGRGRRGWRGQESRRAGGRGGNRTLLYSCLSLRRRPSPPLLRVAFARRSGVQLGTVSADLEILELLPIGSCAPARAR